LIYLFIKGLNIEIVQKFNIDFIEYDNQYILNLTL
jgi:hypothetical protein